MKKYRIIINFNITMRIPITFILLILAIFVCGTFGQLFENYNKIVAQSAAGAAALFGEIVYEVVTKPRVLREG